MCCMPRAFEGLTSTRNLHTVSKRLADQVDKNSAHSAIWLPMSSTLRQAASATSAHCACVFSRHAGGHVVGTPALELLEWELSGAALAALQAALAPDTAVGARLSEKGLLQLLFDVRFLRDVLSGGRPLAAAGMAREPPARWAVHCCWSATPVPCCAQGLHAHLAAKAVTTACLAWRLLGHGKLCYTLM